METELSDNQPDCFFMSFIYFQSINNSFFLLKLHLHIV